MTEPRSVDPDRLKETARRAFDQLSGAVTAAMMYLGDDLGLYRALGEAAGFGRFARLAVEHPINAFYEARPC